MLPRLYVYLYEEESRKSQIYDKGDYEKVYYRRTSNYI